MTSGTWYSERKKLLLGVRHRPTHWYHYAKSHSRPVVPLPELLDDDGPANRVLTQPQEERIAYEDGGCGEACTE